MQDENPQINNILEILNSPDVTDKLKDMLGSFSSDESSEDFNNILSYLDSFFKNDSLSRNSNFLNALKPFLSEKRQKKISQCEKFTSMIKTFQMINTINKD